MSTSVRLPEAIRNPVSVLGVAVATSSAILFVVLFLLDLLGYLVNPYIGLVLFVTVPVLFLIGLALIPIGVRWAARRRRHAPSASDWPVIDLGQPHQRRVLGAILALTVANLIIVSMAAYGGVHYMESAEFCGEVCHTTMEPQYTAYRAWPHARVGCSACHIGSGAGALVESKLAGTRQLLHVATGRVTMPIPTPVQSLRPARETCEQCHWPEKSHGDRTRFLREYSDDEANSETVSAMQLHVGGGSRELGVGTGIHWHMNLDNRVEYVATDGSRQTIPYVRFTGRDGLVKEYVVPGADEEQLRAGVRRVMDCVDCHNRPAHTFHATPERAIDAALAQGALPRDLPFVRREAVAAVREEYADRAAALAGIARRLEEFYASRGGADARLVARAVSAAQQAWSQNVFPDMAVTWGTYPSQLGHTDAPGCFRCHDDQHVASDGSVIRQDCELCHTFPE